MAKSLVECANDQASENRPLPIASARSCPSLERENAVPCHSFRAAPLLAAGLANSPASSTTKLQTTSGMTAPRGRNLLSALNSFGSRMGMSSMSAGRSRPLGSRRQSCRKSATDEEDKALGFGTGTPLRTQLSAPQRSTPNNAQ